MTLNRRNVLALGAAAGATALPPSAGASAPTDRPALTPHVTEGPYYLGERPRRADVSEGLPGVPVELRFTVLDETGAPLPGADVDLWHCDARGLYSGFGGEPGREPDAKQKAARYLRGVYATDAHGVVAFRTVYPGWYTGRTTHIHLKVWHAGVAVLTTQVFLPDALNEFLYTQAPDYRRAQPRDTLNRDDGIAREAGAVMHGAVQDQDDRYLLAMTLAVDRAAKPVVEHGPGMGPPPGFDPARFAKDDGHGPPHGPPPGMRPPWGDKGPPAGFAGGPPPGFGPPHGEALQGQARLTALIPGPTRESKRQA